jgi:hypothetical protein
LVAGGFGSAQAAGTDAEPASAAMRRAKVRLENEFMNSTPVDLFKHETHNLVRAPSRQYQVAGG